MAREPAYETDRQAVAEFIERYRRGFQELDSAQLAGLWQADHVPLIYIAQEKSGPIQGFAGIRTYYEQLPVHLDSIEMMEVDDLTIDLLDNVALVFFGFRVRGRLKGQDEPHEPVGRVSAVLRRVGGDWRFVHYHESALGPHPV